MGRILRVTGWYTSKIPQYVPQIGIGRYRYQTYVAVGHSGHRPGKKKNNPETGMSKILD
jgi:hypothetical protein